MKSSTKAAADAFVNKLKDDARLDKHQEPKGEASNHIGHVTINRASRCTIVIGGMPNSTRSQKR